MTLRKGVRLGWGQHDIGPLGTNLFRLQVRGTDPAAFRTRLAANGVLVSEAQRDTFLIGVNETLNRTTAPALTEAFVRAVTGA